MVEPPPIDIVTGRCSLCGEEAPTLHAICRRCIRKLFRTELRRRVRIEQNKHTRSKLEQRAIMVEKWLAGEETRQQLAEFGRNDRNFLGAIEQGLKATRLCWWERNGEVAEGRAWLQDVCPICTAEVERLARESKWGPMMKAVIGIWRRHGENAGLETTPPNRLYGWANRWIAPVGKDGGFRAPCTTVKRET